jgi:hypothetical protein
MLQQEGGDRHVKIGYSCNLDNRIQGLINSSSYQLKLIGTIYADDKEHAMRLEKSIHTRLRRYRIRGEWFDPKCLGAMKDLIGLAD